MSAVTDGRVGRALNWQRAMQQGSMRQESNQAGIGLGLGRRALATLLRTACGMASIVTVRSRAAVC